MHARCKDCFDGAKGVGWHDAKQVGLGTKLVWSFEIISGWDELAFVFLYI
jgi:hypothetical protein